MSELVAHRDGARATLASPQPGVFRPTARARTWLVAGDTLGTLEVLGRQIALVVPHGIEGAVAHEPRHGAVGYGDVLAVLDSAARPSSGADEPHAVDATHVTTGMLFRAPTSGRYYGRSTPDKPAFVTVGTELAPGATVCLLEVMKTFNRVTYAGAPARVRELLVADGADVNAGDPILALDPVST